MVANKCRGRTICIKRLLRKSLSLNTSIVSEKNSIHFLIVISDRNHCDTVGKVNILTGSGLSEYIAASASSMRVF